MCPFMSLIWILLVEPIWSLIESSIVRATVPALNVDSLPGLVTIEPTFLVPNCLLSNVA